MPRQLGRSTTVFSLLFVALGLSWTAMLAGPLLAQASPDPAAEPEAGSETAAQADELVVSGQPELILVPGGPSVEAAPPPPPTPATATETPIEGRKAGQAASPTTLPQEPAGIDNQVGESTPNPPWEPLMPRHARWLQEVDVLISGPERVAFSRLSRNYQRRAFIEEFWKVRDPYPRTTRNELKERWPVRVAEAKSKWENLLDDRSRLLLAQGPPDGSFEVQCTTARSPAEVWMYRGTDWTDVSTALVFYRMRGRGPARLWVPSSSGSGALQELRRSINCRNGSNLVQLMNLIESSQSEYENQLRQLLVKPQPSSKEWIHTFAALSTDLPYDARPISGELDISFPGRHQHRTVVQGVITLDAVDLGVSEFAGYRSYDIQLNGEVLGREGELFESFRYKYGFATETVGPRIPLAFQRFLRPGKYRLVVLASDLGSERVFRSELEIEVPQADGVFEMSTFRDPETEKLFAEATAAMAAGETGIRLIPPAGDLQTGFTRFDALVSGDDIQKVRFSLDDKPILTRNRPPYQVSIDLGPYPDVRAIRAEALDGDGQMVADDEILINTGGYRFVVKLKEPRPNQTYTRSSQARMEIDVPENRSLERVELYLNEILVATLYQEPFSHPIPLPETKEVAYVRAVAYLPDGNFTEDLVFINATGEIEELEVQFVELYTTVLDKQGRPVTGLSPQEITVVEDGVRQEVARFEEVRDLPIHVGVLLDTSASMVGVLDDVRRAALTFIDQSITPKDRAAVITFNNFPELEVELTSDKASLGAGLAGLSPEGQTALYDSVMFGLYYFAGIKGQRAILVLSDGRDESSRFDFEQTLEYARRAGITIYTIGLRLDDAGARRKLDRLAEETGGSSHFIREIDELAEIYDRIEDELRSQLLVGYQSSNTTDDEAFRQIEVLVSRPDVSARTISGYYP